MNKILVITSGLITYPPFEGGAVENLLDLLVEENEKNPKVDFVIYSIEPKQSYKLKDYKHTEIRFIKRNKILKMIYGFISKITNRLLPNYYIHSIIKDLTKEKAFSNYDYVLIENMPIYAIYFRRLFNNNIIMHVHNDWLNIDTRYSKLIVDSCYKIITVSDYVKKRIYQIDKNSQVSTIMNGIDTYRFSSRTKKSKDLLKKYNIDENDIVFIFTGKLKEEKGAYQAVLAFERLNKEYENVKLMMVGSSFNKNDKDTQYIKNIKEIVNSNKNIIITGFIDYGDIQDIYSIGDIQLVPSQCEDSCPLVVMEGLSSSLALIVSNSGGIPEIVNSKCAFQIDRGTDFVTNMYLSMKDLVDNPSKLRIMKQESFKRSNCFKKEVYTNNMLKVLGEVKNE